MNEQRNLDRMIVLKNKEESRYSPFKCFPEYHEDKNFKNKLHGNDLLHVSFKLGTSDFLENNKFKKYSCQSRLDENQRIKSKNNINEKLDNYTRNMSSPLLLNTKQILSNDKDYFDVQNKYLFNNDIPSESEFKKIWINNLDKFKFQEKYHDIYGLLLEENKLNDIIFNEKSKNEYLQYMNKRNNNINSKQTNNKNDVEDRKNLDYITRNNNIKNSNNFQSEYSNYKKPNFYDKTVHEEYKQNKLDGYGKNLVTSPYKDYSKLCLEKENGLKNMYTGNNKYINDLYLHKYYDNDNNNNKGLKHQNFEFNERMLNCSSKSYNIIKNS